MKKLSRYFSHILGAIVFVTASVGLSHSVQAFLYEEGIEKPVRLPSTGSADFIQSLFDKGFIIFDFEEKEGKDDRYLVKSLRGRLFNPGIKLFISEYRPPDLRVDLIKWGFGASSTILEVSFERFNHVYVMHDDGNGVQTTKKFRVSVKLDPYCGDLGVEELSESLLGNEPFTVDGFIKKRKIRVSKSSRRFELVYTIRDIKEVSIPFCVTAVHPLEEVLDTNSVTAIQEEITK